MKLPVNRIGPVPIAGADASGRTVRVGGAAVSGDIGVADAVSASVGAAIGPLCTVALRTAAVSRDKAGLGPQAHSRTSTWDGAHRRVATPLARFINSVIDHDRVLVTDSYIPYLVYQ